MPGPWPLVTVTGANGDERCKVLNGGYRLVNGPVSGGSGSFHYTSVRAFGRYRISYSKCGNWIIDDRDLHGYIFINRSSDASAVPMYGWSAGDCSFASGTPTVDPSYSQTAATLAVTNGPKGAEMAASKVENYFGSTNTPTDSLPIDLQVHDLAKSAATGVAKTVGSNLSGKASRHVAQQVGLDRESQRNARRAGEAAFAAAVGGPAGLSVYASGQAIKGAVSCVVSDVRDDFGWGICVCEGCGSTTKNRGCKLCDENLCVECWHDHHLRGHRTFEA